MNEHYWTEETESFVIQYTKTQDEEIFTTHIYPALKIIASHFAWKYLNGYRQYLNDSVEDIVNMAITKAYCALPTFDPAKGRAYSYFTRVIHRYILNLSRDATLLKYKNVVRLTDDILRIYKQSPVDDNTYIGVDVVTLGQYLENNKHRIRSLLPSASSKHLFTMFLKRMKRNEMKRLITHNKTYDDLIVCLQKIFKDKEKSDFEMFGYYLCDDKKLTFIQK